MTFYYQISPLSPTFPFIIVCYRLTIQEVIQCPIFDAIVPICFYFLQNDIRNFQCLYLNYKRPMKMDMPGF